MLSAEGPAGAVAVVGHVVCGPGGLLAVGSVPRLRRVSGWRGLLSFSELWSGGMLQCSPYEAGMAVETHSNAQERVGERGELEETTPIGCFVSAMPGSRTLRPTADVVRSAKGGETAQHCVSWNRVHSYVAHNGWMEGVRGDSHTPHTCRTRLSECWCAVGGIGGTDCDCKPAACLVSARQRAAHRCLCLHSPTWGCTPGPRRDQNTAPPVLFEKGPAVSKQRPGRSSSQHPASVRDHTPAASSDDWPTPERSHRLCARPPARA